MKKKLLVLNDLHVGSSFGLLPPDFMDTKGNVHLQNCGQKYLWERFTQTLSRIQPQHIDAVVINGDLCDGMQPKNKGVPLTLHRWEDQREASVAVLMEVKNTFPTAQWFFIEGTPYHEERDNVVQAAYLLLEKTPDVRRTLKLRVGDAILQFHHETSFSGGITKAGSLEKEIVNQWLAEASNDWDKVHCEVRAHCHYFAYVGRKDRLAIVCPAWQLQTEYSTKNSPNKNIPDIGCVVLTVDDSLLKYGTCPVSFQEYLYKHPSPAIVDITDDTDAVALDSDVVSVA
jgi:hypothetical protein